MKKLTKKEEYGFVISFTLLVGFLFFMFVMPLISAEDNIQDFKTYKLNDVVNLKNNCVNITFNNITSISVTGKNNLEFLVSSIEMNQVTNGLQTYSFTNTSYTGTYIVMGICDENGEYKTWSYTFEVSPSGNSGTANIIFILMLFIISYGITYVGFFQIKNVWISVLGGFLMLILGLYVRTDGLIIYQDWVTNAISFITIGIGIIVLAFCMEDMLNQ